MWNRRQKFHNLALAEDARQTRHLDSLCRSETSVRCDELISRGIYQTSVKTDDVLGIQKEYLEKRLNIRAGVAREILLKGKPPKRERDRDLVLAFVEPVLTTGKRTLLQTLETDSFARSAPHVLKARKQWVSQVCDEYRNALKRDLEIDIEMHHLRIGTQSNLKNAALWVGRKALGHKIGVAITLAAAALLARWDAIAEWLRTLLAK